MCHFQYFTTGHLRNVIFLYFCGTTTWGDRVTKMCDQVTKMSMQNFGNNMQYFGTSYSLHMGNIHKCLASWVKWNIWNPGQQKIAWFHWEIRGIRKDWIFRYLSMPGGNKNHKNQPQTHYICKINKNRLLCLLFLYAYILPRE